MYWKPKDGYPDLNTYQGFSVGDLVRLPWNSSFGEIVRICQMPHWDSPTIIIEWLTNGRIGHHTIESLELIMTHEDMMKKKPWFIITQYDAEMGEYIAVLNGASQEIGFGVNPEHAVYDLLKEINVVGLDSQQYCWGRA